MYTSTYELYTHYREVYNYHIIIWHTQHTSWECLNKLNTMSLIAKKQRFVDTEHNGCMNSKLKLTSSQSLSKCAKI